MIIALEGTEGSGKTVHAKLLDDHLRSQGFQTVLLKEPSKFLAGLDEYRKMENGAALVEILEKKEEVVGHEGERVR